MASRAGAAFLTLHRGPGAMISLRISRAALSCCTASGLTAAGRENYRDGVDQPTESDSASADQAGHRQHAVARFDGAGPKPGAACQGVGTDLLARHDGC